MNKSFFFPFQRVTDADLNFIETSKEEAIKQQAAFILAKFNHQFSGSIPVNLRQSIQDILINPNTYRGIGGGYGSDYLKPVTGSVSSISINRGWAITDGMDIIILSNPVTINQGDNTFNKSWGTLVNGNTAYVTIEYQQSSSSVGNDAQGNTYYKRYFGNYKIVVSSTYPSNSNQVPLATFIANGNLITPGTFQDVREWARPWGVSDSTIDPNPIISSLKTVYDHTHAVGTGVPSITNPHGLSLNDLGFIDSVVTHRTLEHGNGIILLEKTEASFLSYSGSIISPTSNAYIVFNPPNNAVASINGVLFSGSLSNLPGTAAGGNGTYWVVSNQAGQTSFISTSSINFNDNEPLRHPQYLLLGQATVADNGDDITSYIDLRRFYTMSPTVIRADYVEGTSSPAEPLRRTDSIIKSLDRIRHQVGLALNGSGSQWNGSNPLTAGSSSNADPYHTHSKFIQGISQVVTGDINTWDGNIPIIIGGQFVGSGIKSLANQFNTILNVTASRALNTTYTNNLGRTIYVTVSIWFRCISDIATPEPQALVNVKVNGMNIAQCGIHQLASNVTLGTYQSINFFVPPNSNYRIDSSTLPGGTVTLLMWIEYS